MPFDLHQEFKAPFLNSPPQSAWMALTFLPVARFISFIACFRASVVSLFARIGIAMQYREKSSIMVKTYFSPNHFVSMSPIRSQWILSRISCVQVISLGFAPGLVDFPLIHAMHSALENSCGGISFASGNFFSAGNERCPYLSCSSCSLFESTFKVIILFSFIGSLFVGIFRSLGFIHNPSESASI